MGKVVTYTCDGPGCEKQYSPTNGWWLVWIENDAGRRHTLSMSPMTADGPAGDDLTICGHACVQKVVERHMSEVGK